MIAFGVGAQAPAWGKLDLSPAEQRIWKIIADQSPRSACAATYTAEVLWDLGIKNVRIVGCPTAFRNNDPDLRIDLPPLDRSRTSASRCAARSPPPMRRTSRPT